MSDSAIESILSVGRIIKVFKVQSQLAYPQGHNLLYIDEINTRDINHNIFETEILDNKLYLVTEPQVAYFTFIAL